LDNLQHIDNLLKQASQVPANALVTASDWAAVEKKLKQRKNRIYAMWFFLALICAGTVIGLIVTNIHSLQTNPNNHVVADTKTEVIDNAHLSQSPNKENDYDISTTDEIDINKLLEHNKTTEPNETTEAQISIDEVSRFGLLEESTPTREKTSIKTSADEGRLEIFNLLPISATFTQPNLPVPSKQHIGYSDVSLPTDKSELQSHWEMGLSFTPGLSNKIASVNNALSYLINPTYNNTVKLGEQAAFSNTFGFNTQYHRSQWFIASGLFMTQRNERIDYNYKIEISPTYDNDIFNKFLPVVPGAQESIVYSGSNSYHFIEIPISIGYKQSVSPTFEIRTQVGLSYMALLNREGKKGNFTTLRLDDLKNLQFNQHNIAANIKTGLYLNKPRFVVGVEPLFGININSLRSPETSAIKTNPYGYGVNLTTAVKLFRL